MYLYLFHLGAILLIEEVK